MSAKNSKTILFITGAFVSNSIWEEWQQYFEKRGYKTFAPAWLFKDASVEVIRSFGEKNPDKIASYIAPEVDWYIYESNFFP